MKYLGFVLLVALSCTLYGAFAFDPEIICATCVMFLGLGEQIEFQIALLGSLMDSCDGETACELASHNLVFGLMEKLRPEDLCDDIGICTNEASGCTLWPVWPVPKLPDAPPDWPTERRELRPLKIHREFTMEVKYTSSLDMSSLIPFFDGSLAMENIPLPQLIEKDMDITKLFALTLSLLKSQEESPKKEVLPFDRNLQNSLYFSYLISPSSLNLLNATEI